MKGFFQRIYDSHSGSRDSATTPAHKPVYPLPLRQPDKTDQRPLLSSKPSRHEDPSYAFRSSENQGASRRQPSHSDHYRAGSIRHNYSAPPARSASQYPSNQQAGLLPGLSNGDPTSHLRGTKQTKVNVSEHLPPGVSNVNSASHQHSSTGKPHKLLPPSLPHNMRSQSDNTRTTGGPAPELGMPSSQKGRFGRSGGEQDNKYPQGNGREREGIGEVKRERMDVLDRKPRGQEMEMEGEVGRQGGVDSDREARRRKRETEKAERYGGREKGRGIVDERSDGERKREKDKRRERERDILPEGRAESDRDRDREKERTRRREREPEKERERERGRERETERKRERERERGKEQQGDLEQERKRREREIREREQRDRQEQELREREREQRDRQEQEQRERERRREPREREQEQWEREYRERWEREQRERREREKRERRDQREREQRERQDREQSERDQRERVEREQSEREQRERREQEQRDREREQRERQDREQSERERIEREQRERSQRQHEYYLRQQREREKRERDQWERQRGQERESEREKQKAREKHKFREKDMGNDKDTEQIRPRTLENKRSDEVEHRREDRGDDTDKEAMKKDEQLGQPGKELEKERRGLKDRSRKMSTERRARRDRDAESGRRYREVLEVNDNTSGIAPVQKREGVGDQAKIEESRQNSTQDRSARPSRERLNVAQDRSQEIANLHEKHDIGLQRNPEKHTVLWGVRPATVPSHDESPSGVSQGKDVRPTNRFQEREVTVAQMIRAPYPEPTPLTTTIPLLPPLGSVPAPLASGTRDLVVPEAASTTFLPPSAKEAVNKYEGRIQSRPEPRHPLFSAVNPKAFPERKFPPHMGGSLAVVQDSPPRDAHNARTVDPFSIRNGTQDVTQTAKASSRQVPLQSKEPTSAYTHRLDTLPAEGHRQEQRRQSTTLIDRLPSSSQSNYYPQRDRNSSTSRPSQQAPHRSEAEFDVMPSSVLHKSDSRGSPKYPLPIVNLSSSSSTNLYRDEASLPVTQIARSDPKPDKALNPPAAPSHAAVKTVSTPNAITLVRSQDEHQARGHSSTNISVPPPPITRPPSQLTEKHSGGLPNGTLAKMHPDAGISTEKVHEEGQSSMNHSPGSLNVPPLSKKVSPQLRQPKMVPSIDPEAPITIPVSTSVPTYSSRGNTQSHNDNNVRPGTGDSLKQIVSQKFARLRDTLTMPQRISPNNSNTEFGQSIPRDIRSPNGNEVQPPIENMRAPPQRHQAQVPDVSEFKVISNLSNGVSVPKLVAELEARSRMGDPGVHVSHPPTSGPKRFTKDEPVSQVQIWETTNFTRPPQQVPTVPPSPMILPVAPPTLSTVPTATSGHPDVKATKEKAGVSPAETGDTLHAQNVKFYPSMIGPHPEEIIPLPSSSSPLRTHASRDMIGSQGRGFESHHPSPSEKQSYSQRNSPSGRLGTSSTSSPNNHPVMNTDAPPIHFVAPPNPHPDSRSLEPTPSLPRRTSRLVTSERHESSRYEQPPPMMQSPSFRDARLADILSSPAHVEQRELLSLQKASLDLQQRTAPSRIYEQPPVLPALPLLPSSDKHLTSIISHTLDSRSGNNPMPTPYHVPSDSVKLHPAAPIPDRHPEAPPRAPPYASSQGQYPRPRRLLMPTHSNDRDPQYPLTPHFNSTEPGPPPIQSIVLQDALDTHTRESVKVFQKVPPTSTRTSLFSGHKMRRRTESNPSREIPIVVESDVDVALDPRPPPLLPLPPIAPLQMPPTQPQFSLLKPPGHTASNISRAPSEESILKTPSSLAPVLKPTVSQTSIPISVSSETRKRGIFSMFRSKKTQQPPKAPIGLSGTIPKATESDPATAGGILFAPEPPPIPAPIPEPDHKIPDSKPFTPFKYLSSKRHRTVSAASLEAQDGTAPNTVVGSPTTSVRSSQPPIRIPSLRDPLLATQEWRKLEAAEVRERSGGKVRRQRPGVVFDVVENHSEERRPKLRSRRRPE